MALHLVQPARCSNGGTPTDDCNHTASQIVSRPCRNGTSHWVRQCQICGDALGLWIKQNPLAPRDMPEWDEELQRLWRDRNQPRLL